MYGDSLSFPEPLSLPGDAEVGDDGSTSDSLTFPDLLSFPSLLSFPGGGIGEESDDQLYGPIPTSRFFAVDSDQDRIRVSVN